MCDVGYISLYTLDLMCKIIMLEKVKFRMFLRLGGDGMREEKENGKRSLVRISDKLAVFSINGELSLTQKRILKAAGKFFGFLLICSIVSRGIYSAKLPQISTDYGVNMTLGHKKIKIKDVVKIGKKYYITGKNFTESSKISLDDELLSTTYLTPELLGLNEKVDKEDVPKLKVSQIDSKDNTILSSINSLEEL